MLQFGQVEIVKKNGDRAIIPQVNLENTMRLLGDKIAKVNYYEPPPPVIEPKKAPPKPSKTKATLLGSLYKDNKITAKELIDWINLSDSDSDIKLVMEGETRKTVLEASKTRRKELIDKT